MESASDEMMRLIMQAWQAGGEASVRELLAEAGVPGPAIDTLIAQILQAEQDMPATMPVEQIRMLMRNTVAVKTNAPEKLVEWRAQVQKFYDGAAVRGQQWAIELDFARALLNVLDNRPAALPAKHPYEPYLQEVLRAIKR